VARAPTTNYDKSNKSRSQSRKKSNSPIRYDSPRRKLYEAKFEKFIANKDAKTKVRQKTREDGERRL